MADDLTPLPPPLACGPAMERLSAGSGRAADPTWAATLAHVATCPACGERLACLARAVLAPAAEEAPCAEWQARLADHQAQNARGALPAPPPAGLADHLAACRRCQVVADLVAVTAAPLTWASLPLPAQDPRFDTGFLGQATADPVQRQTTVIGGATGWGWRRALVSSPARIVHHVRSALHALRARLIGPGQPRRESPLSLGVLGLALAAILILVVVAGTWRLMRPREVPLPAIPRAATASPSASPSATATATVTAGATLGPGRPADLPAGLTVSPAPGASPTVGAPVEPAERPERPQPRATASPRPVSPATDPPYPPPLEQPTFGPTEDPYPGLGGTGTAGPYPPP